MTQNCTHASTGILEILQNGTAFIRQKQNSYFPSNDDIPVSGAQIKKSGIRNGDLVSHSEGQVASAIEKGMTVRPEFDKLTPIHPHDRFKLDSFNCVSTRIMDLFVPVGKGQRCLIVAPPRTGKTMLLMDIAKAIEHSHPEVKVLMLLVDERPEEVTEMRESITGEVISSTFDEHPGRHVRVAELVLEHAKRLVEQKRDVVILLDSITRLARAYNQTIRDSGRVLSGGLDANALHKPKRFFGAARTIREGGSLTIIATALVDTGSRMDDVIFEEFKGTGNAEIHLDRRLMEKRLFPCMDPVKSGTRKEELLYPAFQYPLIQVLRKVLFSMTPMEAIGFVVEKMKGSRTNSEFLSKMNCS